MNVTMGVDLLHRRIEEWTEEAAIEPTVSDMDAEAFREYGSDLIAFLHDVVDELELGQESMILQQSSAGSRELCDELLEIIVEEGMGMGLGTSSMELRLEGLPDVFEAIGDVLEAPVADSDEELEEAVDGLEDFLADTW